MDELALKAKELVEKLEAASPAVAEMAMWAIRLDCVAYIIGWFLGASVVTFASYVFFRRHIEPSILAEFKERKEWGHYKNYTNYREMDSYIGWYWFSSIPLILYLPLLHIWAWIGLFAPELLLTHQIISSVVK